MKRSNRPYVLLNMSMSADGKIASANRAINHFSSERDHENLHRLRATADAILNGARTVDTAAIKMDTGPDKFRKQRLRNKLSDHAIRVIATGNGSLNPNAEVFNHRFSPIIVLTTSRCSKNKLTKLQQAADEVIVAGEKELDFPTALKELRKQWKVKRLLCEGGGALNDALFRADLVDEIHLTICPVIIGGRDAPTISDGAGMDRLADARQFELQRRRTTDNEQFLTYIRKRT